MFLARPHNRPLFYVAFYTLLLVGSLLILLAQGVQAADLQQLQEDLSPIKGVVVMAMDAEYIVDLDATDGLRQGDLLRVATKGEAIVHPLTQEVIGRLSETRAVLQVRQVQSGYAYARTLSQTQTQPLEPGTPVERYAGLNAWLVADRNAQPLYTRLRSTLPHLNWQAPLGRDAFAQKAADAPSDLFFVVDGAQLTLKNGSQAPIASYLLPADLVAGGASVNRPLAAAPVVEQQAAQGLIQMRRTNPAQGVWRSDKFSGAATGLSLADLDGDRQNEVLLLAQKKLYIGQISNRQWQTITTFDFPQADKALHLDSLDLDQDGAAEILVTLWNDDHPELRAYSLKQKRLTLKAQWKGFARVVTWPGRGAQLYGQAWGGNNAPFGNKIRPLTWQQGTLQEQSALNLPAVANLYNFQPFAAAGEQTLVALIDSNDHLQVFNENGERRYKDAAIYGGQRSYFSIPDPDNFRESDVKMSVYLAPRLRLGPQGELLVPVNTGSRFMKNQRDYSSSYLLALAWEHDAPVEVWRTRETKKYLADFYLGDFFRQQQPVLGLLYGDISGNVLDFFGKKSSDMTLTLTPLTEGVRNSQQRQ